MISFEEKIDIKMYYMNSFAGITIVPWNRLKVLKMNLWSWNYFRAEDSFERITAY